MKRFIGLCLTTAGAALALWSGYHVLLGESSQKLFVVSDYPVSAMMGGLAGVTAVTLGFVWMRD